MKEKMNEAISNVTVEAKVQSIKDAIEKTFDNVQVTPTEVQKPNGVKHGIIVCYQDTPSNVNPCFYVEDYANVEEMLDAITGYMQDPQDCKKVQTTILSTVEEVLSDKDQLSQSIYPRLISKKQNPEPEFYSEQLDFYITYAVEFDYIDVAAGAIITEGLSKKILETLDMTKEELQDLAFRNLEKEIGILSLKSIIEKMMGVTLPDDEPRLYCITRVTDDKEDPETIANAYSAAGILLESVHEKCRELFPNGYYVLPASVHECLVVDAEHMTEEKATKMVNEVNDSEVKDCEVLSDHAYSSDEFVDLF